MLFTKYWNIKLFYTQHLAQLVEGKQIHPEKKTKTSPITSKQNVEGLSILPNITQFSLLSLKDMPKDYTIPVFYG